MAAKRGSLQRMSQDQEEFLARSYDGQRVKGSGSSHRQKGDVITETQLIEAKFKGTPDKPAKSISIKLEDFEKICDEAWAEGLSPMMGLMIVNPKSPLANASGNIHLSVRLVIDDMWYSAAYRNDLHGNKIYRSR